VEELKYNVRCEISTISGEVMQIVTSSAVVPSAFCQEGNIFSICCNTGEFC